MQKYQLTLQKQRDAVDCGPSCLAMIAKYYGLSPSIDHLRQQCVLGRNGISMLSISKAAEELGLKTIPGRLSFETLESEVPLPCIAHWDQRHFVVVYKIEGHKKGRYTVYVVDPAKGFVTYTKDEFCEHWISTRSN